MTEGKVDLKEPVIRKKDVLILEDRYFKSENVCIVTGAASGIGRATALAMAANGVKVLCADVDEAGGAATVKMAAKLGGEARFFRTDLTRDASIEACVAEAAKMGKIKVSREHRRDPAHRCHREFPDGEVRPHAGDHAPGALLPGEAGHPPHPQEPGRRRCHRQHGLHPRPHHDA